jgi:hypothetical protein
MRTDEVVKYVLSLAREGSILPFCDDCGMVLTIAEIDSEMCEACGNKFDINNIKWMTPEALPQA